MKLLVAIVVLCALAGCASLFGVDQSGSAAQIKASVSDKNINAICTITPTPWGTAKVNVLSVDETSATNSTSTMKGDCSELSVTTVKPLPPPPKVVAVPVAAPVSP